MVSREGNVGPPVPLDETTRVVEFNDLEALERELAHGDVACVLAEPALTNIGIVLPEPGFHERLRDGDARDRDAADHRRDAHALRRAGRLHAPRTGSSPTCSRSASRSAAASRSPPTGSRPRSPSGSRRCCRPTRRPTSAGSAARSPRNALSLAATRATLAEVLTDEAFERMIALGERFEAGVAETIERHGLPWHVTRLGCRVEYLFRPERPRTGSEAAAGGDRAARPADPPLRAQPRHPADAVPQHGADVARHDRGRRRPAHASLRRSGPRADVIV